jgi:hypothetical protein
MLEILIRPDVKQTRDDMAFAVLGWIQQGAIDGIFSVRCHVSDTGVLVDAEITFKTSIPRRET